ncbi:MAG: tRNA (N(6)-L-threonylcarbamoyladenosine(37)-C(2))-methylthiotransferase MtaB [Deltaproteobacteria bacterium]|nr:tRNA (N(6)-L-threonylcarbamoyladenosine(37)-C(2))-methylthiotransferase MtaB [Deltaproteobacteria bacterium]
MTSRPGTSDHGLGLGFATFGCKVNQGESAYLAETATRLGFKPTAPQVADILVVNTCTVTARTDAQVRQMLRQASRRSSLQGIIITGCYAQRAPQELACFPKVRAVLGNAEKSLWPDLLPALANRQQPLVQVRDMDACREFSFLPLRNFYGHTRAFLKIQDGCRHGCAYCIVPRVRGPERSLPLQNLRQQVEDFVAAGFKEIVLTGINLARYGPDLPGQPSLTSVVRLLRQASEPVRFRLSSLEPQHINPDLLQELAEWPQFCPHFHIPLQSGASAVLAAMQRDYQASWFAALIQEIAAMFPAAAIGLDVMTGFPTESAADYYQTRELIDRLPVSYLHVFPYSPRPGTVAAGLSPKATPAEIQDRARDLRALGLQKKALFYQGQVGQVVEVLVEGSLAGKPGWVKGLTGNYLRVHLPGPPSWVNRMVRVRLREVAGQSLIGEAYP